MINKGQIFGKFSKKKPLTAGDQLQQTFRRLISGQGPSHLDCRQPIYPLLLESPTSDVPHASTSVCHHRPCRRMRRVAHSPAIEFHLRCCRPLTRSSTYLYLTFEPCNSIFQTLLCPADYLSWVFCLSFLISLRSRGVLWIVGPSSIPVQCFSCKGGPFPCKIQFFRYFSDFQ